MTSEAITWDAETSAACLETARQAGVSLGVAVLEAVAFVAARWSGRPDIFVGLPIARPEFFGVPGLSVASLPVRVQRGPAIQDGFSLRAVSAEVGLALDHATLDLAKLRTHLDEPPNIWLWFNDLTQGTTAGRWLDLDWIDDLAPRSVPLFPVNVTATLVDGRLTVHMVAREADRLLLKAFLAQVRDRVKGRSSDRPVLSATLPPATVDTWDLVCARAHSEPTRLAVRCSRRGDISFAELRQKVLERAASWSARFEPGCLVALPARKDVDFVVGLLAGRLAGLTVALIDEAWPAQRVATLMSVHGIVSLAEETGTGAGGARDGPPGHVLFTSGTSNAPPAGVLVPHRTLDRALDAYCHAVGLGESDVVPFLNSPAHDPALRDTLATLRCGGVIAIPDVPLQEPAAWAAWAAAAGVTVVHATPLVLHMLAGAGVGIPALRLIVSGADHLSWDTVAHLRSWAPDSTVAQVYGCSETPQAATVAFLGDAEAAALGAPSVGTPVVPGTIHIVDSDLEPLGIGELGRVLATEPIIAAGYLSGSPRDGFIPNWRGRRAYLTGDIGWRDPEGSLRLVGRADRQVKINGHLASLGELEGVAVEFPGVIAARATAARRGEVDVVNLYIQALQAVNTTRLRAYLRDRLPSELMPAAITEVDIFDTARGKPLLPVAGQDIFTREDLEAAACQLAGRPLGLDENLMEVGLDSMDLLRLHAFLCTRSGEEWSVLTIFAYPTLRALWQRTSTDLRQRTRSDPDDGAYAHSRAVLERVRTTILRRNHV